MKALLIEDDPCTARAIELLLTTEGCDVCSTDLGQEGLDLSKLYDFDIILLDLNLPDMHGYAVLKALRIAKVHTPVLILTGVSDRDSKVCCLTFGADDYVTKPFHRDELMGRLRAVTHVPANGWVASGAVELFLAGVRRSADVSARFAVHSWEDDSGRGPNDYSPNDQKNRAYIDYYRIMGMSEDEAKAFYAMTNSAPFARPRYMTAREMMPWARYDDPVAVAVAARPGALARTEVGSAQARADF